MADECASHYGLDDVDQFVEEEINLAESMSMAVLLSLNNYQGDNKHPRKRSSNLKDMNRLETVDETSQGKAKALIQRLREAFKIKKKQQAKF